jgi:predicted Zn-dependent protease
MLRAISKESSALQTRSSAAAIAATIASGSEMFHLKTTHGSKRPTRTILSRGIIIENGKLGAPIKDINIMGNGPRMLANTTMAANDLRFKDEGDRRPMDYAAAVALHRQDSLKAEEIGNEAARRILALFGLKKPKTETLPIIIENRVASGAVIGLLDTMSRGGIQQK